MTWNAHSAVHYARMHAGPVTTHYCARAVAKAIVAGGILVTSNNANHFESSLRLSGFRQVYGQPIEGDIAIIDALSGPHEYGHVCIYDGHGVWYSDFVQKSMYPGPRYRKIRPAFKLFRHS